MGQQPRKRERVKERKDQEKKELTRADRDGTFADEVTALGGRGVLGPLATGPTTSLTSESTASERTTPRFGQRGASLGTKVQPTLAFVQFVHRRM